MARAVLHTFVGSNKRTFQKYFALCLLTNVYSRIYGQIQMDQWVILKKTWNWWRDMKEMLGDRESWREGVGDKCAKIYCIHIWNFQKWNNKIISKNDMCSKKKKPYLWVIPSHPRCHCAYKIKWCQSDYDPSSRTLQPISHGIQVETGLSYVCIKVTVFLLQNPPFGPFPPSFSIMLSSFFPVAGWANMF